MDNPNHLKASVTFFFLTYMTYLSYVNSSMTKFHKLFNSTVDQFVKFCHWGIDIREIYALSWVQCGWLARIHILCFTLRDNDWLCAAREICNRKVKYEKFPQGKSTKKHLFFLLVNFLVTLCLTERKRNKSSWWNLPRLLALRQTCHLRSQFLTGDMVTCDITWQVSSSSSSELEDQIYLPEGP